MSGRLSLEKLVGKEVKKWVIQTLHWPMHGNSPVATRVSRLPERGVRSRDRGDLGRMSTSGPGLGGLGARG